MSEKSSGSSWDDLIKEIGASPSPEALERKRAAIETQFEPPPAPSPPPKPQVGDWGALASQLGVEATEPPPRPRESPATPGDLEASFAEIAPMESAFEEFIDEEITDVDFAEGENPLEAGEPAEGQSPGLTGDAARSAFEALFDPAGFSGSFPPPRPRRERETRLDEPDVRHDELEPFGRSQPSRSASGDGSTTERDPNKPRRRSRRRGRGKSAGEVRERPPGSSRAVPDSAAAHDDIEEWDESLPEPQEELEAGEGADSTERTGQRKRRRRRRSGVRGGAPSKPSDEGLNGPTPNGPTNRALDDDLEDDDLAAAKSEVDDTQEDDDDEDIGPRSSIHKSIPTWSEAIGVMVETNMQARKSAPQRPSDHRGRGRSRGGGGRRGRKP